MVLGKSKVLTAPLLCALFILILCFQYGITPSRSAFSTDDKSNKITLKVTQVISGDISSVLSKRESVKKAYLDSLSHTYYLAKGGQHSLFAIANITNRVNNDSIILRDFDYIYSFAMLEVGKLIRTISAHSVDTKQVNLMFETDTSCETRASPNIFCSMDVLITDNLSLIKSKGYEHIYGSKETFSKINNSTRTLTVFNSTISGNNDTLMSREISLGQLLVESLNSLLPVVRPSINDSISVTGVLINNVTNEIKSFNESNEGTEIAIALHSASDVISREPLGIDNPNVNIQGSRACVRPFQCDDTVVIKANVVS